MHQGKMLFDSGLVRDSNRFGTEVKLQEYEGAAR